MSEADPVRIGVDIGGTFTDILAFAPERNRTWMEKVPSTPTNPAEGVINGLEQLFENTAIEPADVTMLSHGSTVTINALIEHTGAKTALLVTEGFTGIPMARHGEKPETEVKNPRYEQPEPYVPQRRVHEITERVDADGEVVTELDESAAIETIEALRAEGVESVAVGLLFSFLNPTHEQRLADLFAEHYPECSLSLSSEIAPRIREFPRISTTTVSAYVDPILGEYLAELAEQLESHGIEPESLSMMLSHGGLTTFEAAADRPASTVLSGPAAGVQGALYAADAESAPDIVTLDMGGTSCDIAIAPDREAITTTEMEIEQNPVSVPMVDIQAIGAGGGTIARASGGRLRVGPDSAGADPGPVCYGRGGAQVTITDANAVLGRLNPNAILGGGLSIELEDAREAVERDIATPLDLSVTEAAAGVLSVVNNKMKKELSLALTQQGYDPRDFALVVYGGAGPMHAPAIAKELSIDRVIVPPRPGINSAVGLLATDRKRLYERSAVERLEDAAVDDHFSSLEAEAEEELPDVPASAIEFQRELELRYTGQSYDLRVAAPAGTSPETLRERFDSSHEQAYGHVSDQPVETMTYRLTVTINADKLASDSLATERQRVETHPETHREVYFDGQYRDVPVYERSSLGIGASFQGPAIVEQTDTTVVVEPGMSVSLDEFDNLVLDTGTT
jgi:N-methylhydantoinase A